MNTIQQYGYRRALIVTDAMLNKLGMAGEVQKALQERDIFSVVYDGVHPNPTTLNVESGLALLKENNCDCVISLGGGSRTIARKVSRWSRQMAATSVTMKGWTVRQNRNCR